jgi:hypothetical protein
MSSETSFTKTQQTIFVGVVALAIVLIGGWYFWPRTPSQMGADEEVFSSVDALFTAITAHDEKLLLQTEQRLKTFKDAGKLPESAAVYLDGVIQDARGGDWQPAAEDLYWFMKGQRREGSHGHSAAKQHK